MTVNQEDALYDFLRNVTEPFTLDDICAFVRMVEPKKSSHLNTETASFLETRRMAFPLEGKRWISRRGAFEKVHFVISPTRLEIANGILIPGHRCLPFANPELLPQKFRFHWKGTGIPNSIQISHGSEIPYTTTESPPEDFYPFYALYGEEYAPQYIARDNPENESAFNCDPFEDPPEVSIQTLDMRNVYRESSFVPGDRFAVTTLDWKEGIFQLERIKEIDWTKEELDNWIAAAEEGFKSSFDFLGPGSSTEEQIAYAYWFGGERMRSLPALSLEDFLYEVTDHIETVPYGIETRFWYAGKDIPDRKDLEGIRSIPDRTVIEEILYRKGVPISEYVVQSYVRDALYRGDKEHQSLEKLSDQIMERIIPSTIGLNGRDKEYLADYILEVFGEFMESYSSFTDHAMGAIRQRVGELHTAVVELAIKLQKSDMDPSWLPKHTFIVLSQIQGHAASILEDLDSDEMPPQEELDAMDNSVDSMIETYEDVKDLINEALGNYRKNNIGLWQKTESSENASWRVIQISLGGTDIWRRLVLPDTYSLTKLAALIRSVFNWSSEELNFNIECKTIGDLSKKGISEFICEIGAMWTVKIIILSWYQAKPDERVRCVAGAGAPPPRFIDGPLRFRRFISALERGGDREQHLAKHELSRDYDPSGFDIDSCNRAIHSGSSHGTGM
ncbi:MAG: plasmid pRiA4b ORF-3 family protein [Treponema sp.]|nr:plasmid pRiA4b ORF-3 family protein [Treponema sp.]